MTQRNSDSTVVSTKTSVLSYLFFQGKFEVPWHQRYYDWSREHVVELLQDLEEASVQDQKCYFLGTILLVEKQDGIWEINDGQQRMVTYSLICAKLAREFTNGSDSLREAQALRVLFNLNETHTTTLSETDEIDPRLTPPRNDSSRYRQLIRGNNIGTNGKLTTAWTVVHDFISNFEIEKAKTFFDFIMNKLEVACLYVPREIDPNLVFETLNARGKPLGSLDLIRNHFYSFFSDENEQPRRDTVHENLEQLRILLREDKKESNSLEYMRCYLQCRYGFIPEKNLYRETKSKIKTGFVNNGYSSSESADYVYNLVQDLTHNDRLQIYNTITAPSEHDAFIVSFLRDSRKSNARRNLLVYLSELKTYKVTQPIVFALLNRYVRESDVTEKKRKARYIHRLLTLLTSFVMRTAFVVPKFEPSHFESAFSNLANKILTDDSWESIPFSNILRDVDEQDVFVDSKFIEQIKHVKQTSLRETGKAKRFLLGVAYHMQSDITLINQNRYTVEHILPASRVHLSGWVGFDQQSHADNVALFGNLTLLSRIDNRPGQSANSAFNSKREIFKNSAVALTREIGQLNEWSPAEIRKRQNKLAKLSAKVWVIPDV